MLGVDAASSSLFHLCPAFPASLAQEPQLSWSGWAGGAHDGGRRDVVTPCTFPRSLKVRAAVAPGSAGWTVDAQTPGGWTGMGSGLLLLQGKTQISIF